MVIKEFFFRSNPIGRCWEFRRFSEFRCREVSLYVVLFVIN